MPPTFTLHRIEIYDPSIADCYTETNSTSAAERELPGWCEVRPPRSCLSRAMPSWERVYCRNAPDCNGGKEGFCSGWTAASANSRFQQHSAPLHAIKYDGIAGPRGAFTTFYARNADAVATFEPAGMMSGCWSSSGASGSKIGAGGTCAMYSRYGLLLRRLALLVLLLTSLPLAACRT